MSDLNPIRALSRSMDRVDSAWKDYHEFCKVLITEDQDDESRLKPYPSDLPHVDSLHKFYATAKRGAVKKSRRMFATTEWCATALHEALRTHTSKTGDLDSSVVISQSEPHAKKVMRRIRGMYDRLPAAFQRPLSRCNDLEFFVEDGGQITGLHAGGQGPRTEGYKRALMDELAFQENADENWRALLACTKYVVAVSTPNGPGNLFYDLAHGRIAGVDILTLHYSMHPDRQPGTEKGDAWIREMKAGMPVADWDREFEIRFDIFAEDGWFSQDFDPACIQDVTWDGSSIITRGWDFGWHRPAVCWSYINRVGQWCDIYEMLGEDINLEDFAAKTLEVSKANWPGAVFRDGGDPAVVQKRPISNAFGENTEWEVLRRMGINLQFDRIRKLRRADGHRMIRMQFKIRPDGRPGMLINPNTCPLILEGFRGGYRMPDRKGQIHQRALELEEPNPADNTFRHLIDARRYAVTQFMGATAIPRYIMPNPVHQIKEARRDSLEAVLAERKRRGLTINLPQFRN